MTYKTAFRQVMKDYDQARSQAEEVLEKRKLEAYETVPQLAEIDRTLAKIGMSLAKLALAGDTKSITEAQDEILYLKEIRQTLIKNSVGENFLTKVYRCNTCNDTGFVQGEPGSPQNPCKCLKQRLVNEYYHLSNMKDVLQDENFDTYDYRLFAGEIIPEEGLSPLKNMEMIYGLATDFVSNFDKAFDNLLLWGAPGLGKTFVCHCIAKDLLDAGKTVLYQTVPRLCKVLEDYRFNRDSMADPDEMLTAIDEVDLLILDDLGAEISTSVTSAALFDVINQRLLTRKHTVISTNLPPDALELRYSQRITSRFVGNYKRIKFFGEDVRVKKRYSGVRI